jgi:serine/threonine protein kinase
LIRFRCSACQQKIKIREEDAGRLGECPKCKAPVEAPRIEFSLPGTGELREDFEAGDEVGEYRLEKLVGKGGFAQVWCARKNGGPPVAIKIPHDTAAVRELLNEGIQLRRLNHPNIVRTIDINLKALPPHIVIEYVDGTSLYALIKRNRTAGEFFPMAFVERIFLQILDGVEHAHAQVPPVVHADLKPHNVLVADQVARIVDFGLGREEKKLERILSTSVQVKSKRKLLGTEAYMAPEQKKGEGTDERTDIYALGMMLQEMLCNEVYCGHTLPGELNPLAVPLDAVVKKATAGLPRMRFRTVAELREAFVGAIRPPAASAPEPAPGAPGGKAADSGIRRAIGAAVEAVKSAVTTASRPDEEPSAPIAAAAPAAAVAPAEDADLPRVEPFVAMLRNPAFLFWGAIAGLLALAIAMSVL